jgi:pimeloyl-ACP methyl ester carboxylesterase
VVLDGVAPPDLPLGRDIARDAQRALDVILARCAADAACHAAYPDLATDFQRLAHQLSEAPATVTLDHPVTGKPTDLVLSGQSFGQAVRLLSDSPETVTLLPLLIHDAAVTGDYGRFAAQALMVGEELANSIAGGMGNTVICSEDAPFFTPEEAAASARGTYLGATTARLLALTCGAWPRADLPADQRAPVRSDAPTLLLSGEADPVTPPANAEHALATLPNGRHVVAPGQGHGILTRGCVPQLVEAFLEAGTATGLDTACVDKLAAQPFFIDYTGPEP